MSACTRKEDEKERILISGAGLNKREWENSKYGKMIEKYLCILSKKF